MRKLKRKGIILLAIIGLFLLLSNRVYAAGTILPTANSNLSVNLISKSELVATSDGYMRVFYDKEKVNIEYYDNNFTIKSKTSLAMELSIWGGFYATSDAYYLVEGQDNTAESDTAEVIRVIKYDTNWKKKGTAKITSNSSLFGGEVRYPFDYGCVEMTEYNGTLYIVTGHEGYVDPTYNQGHQGFLMITVDEKTMTGKITNCDLWHSFAQYIENKDSDLYVLEQSEGSRYTKLSKYNADTLKSTSISVLKYGGSRTSAVAIACRATVDGLAISSDSVLCLGTSIDQTKYDSFTSNTAYNIYLTVTSTSDFSENGTTVKWLTNYSDNGKRFQGTKITKVNDNRFMISWEESDTSQTGSIDDTLSASVLHYIFVDGKGNKLTKEFTAAAPISDCQPIVNGSQIVYYASNTNVVNFYSINATTGAFSKKSYRVVGENATWSIKNNTLTISGTGALFNSNNNSWQSIQEQVQKIVISKGITSIPDNAFKCFEKLTEVTIESGVKSIGKQAFYGCNALRKVTIPESVTSIGEDFVWTGYFWISDCSHVTYATIYAPYNSYAIKYAKKNNISYNTILSNATVSGLKASYEYTGKEQEPQITVKLGSSTLKVNQDYRVTYKNNKKIGKATVTISGIGSYSGTITKTFTITKAKNSIKASNVTKTVNTKKSQTFTLSVKVTGGKVTYQSNNKKITVENNGKVTITKNYVGKAKITITAGDDSYQTTEKTITVTVNPTDSSISSIKNVKGLKISVKWKKNTSVTGYQIQYSTDKKFKTGIKEVTVEKKNTASTTISKLKKNKTYYVRIRTYKTVSKVNYYSNWSKSQEVKISK
jgi:hypothetical protein